MEKTTRSAMVELHSAWNDVGSWDALMQEQAIDADSNVKIGDVVTQEVTNSYLRTSHGLLAVAGVDDLVVVVTDDAVLVANKASWENPEKRKKIESIALLLQAALEANTKVGLKLNIEKSKLDGILADLPALRNPTINRLTDESWVAIDTILDEKTVREIIPELKQRGAEGIIEYPLNKVVY